MFSKRPKAEKVTSLTEIDRLASTGKPVLVDFYQVGCAPCQVMDGIMNELAREYGATAHVVKADITRMPDAIARYKIRATPTMVLLGSGAPKASKRSKQRSSAPGARTRPGTPRWRGQGLVPKDQLARMLESNGARRVDAG
jgi:thiol-disulfide isomerase/thioredoxin